MLMLKHFIDSSLVAQLVKNLPANAGDAGDVGLIPGSGRSPGIGNGNTLNYSCLGNPMGREPAGPQSMGSPKVRHDWVTEHIHTEAVSNTVPILSEKAMAPHFNTLAWKIPWTEEPGRLQSRGSLRVGHDWATSLSLFTFMHWRRKWQPTPAWWAAVYVVAQSRTGLKRLSSSRKILDQDSDTALKLLVLILFCIGGHQVGKY